MSSSVWKPSVTVAAVIERNGRFLLVEEETSHGLRLNQPAGHLEPAETLLQAVVRETLEETTHAFTPTALLGVYMGRGNGSRRGEGPITYLRFAYTGELGEEVPGRRLDAEIVRTLWLTPEEVRARLAMHRSPLVMKCVDDHLGGQRYPLDVVWTHPSVAR
jgi:8-oxo-dGTP pyrophosphatase MutT (NUDIX family)